MTLTSSEPAKITSAALRQAQTKGWPSVTLASVAKESKIPLQKLKKHFTSPPNLIPLIVAEITREAAKRHSPPPAGGVRGGVRKTPCEASLPNCDILFDLLMSRFDVLQKNRAAVLSIAKAAKRDPAMGRILAHAVLESMSDTLFAASSKASPHALYAAGLAAIYAWSFLAWSKDETRDMSKTMATLDRALKRASSIAAYID